MDQAHVGHLVRPLLSQKLWAREGLKYNKGHVELPRAAAAAVAVDLLMEMHSWPLLSLGNGSLNEAEVGELTILGFLMVTSWQALSSLASDSLREDEAPTPVLFLFLTRTGTSISIQIHRIRLTLGVLIQMLGVAIVKARLKKLRLENHLGAIRVLL